MVIKLRKIIEVLLTLCLGISFTSIRTEKNIHYKNKGVICIDPGHGGNDGGCVYEDILEKDINLSIALRLKDKLTEEGYVALMTRIGDYDLSDVSDKNHKRSDILKRVEILNKGSLFFSIHTNEYKKDKKVRGAQVFYYGESNKELALIMQDSLKKVLNNTNREAMSIKDKYLLENTKCKGCLIEIGFISNDEERNLLITESYQDKLVNAIFYGIMNYYSYSNKL